MAAIPEQRQETIVRMLRKTGVLGVQQLADALDVSSMTIRRDILSLEQAGKVTAVSGGARIAEHLRSELGYDAKSLINIKEKKAIAREGLKFINNGMSIYLDAGTTVAQLLNDITQFKDLTIVTNDFTISAALIETSFELIHLGGHIDHENRSSVGPLTAVVMGQLNIDLAFVSTSSWDLKRGLTTPSVSKIDTKLAIKKASAHTVLLADSSKYGVYGMYHICPLSDFDTIISDDSLSPAAAEAIVATGTELILATS